MQLGRTPRIALPGAYDRLFLAIPSGGTWPDAFGMSLAMLTARLTVLHSVNRLENWSMDIKTGSILPNVREGLLMNAEKWGATHTLFLDCDQVFPANIYEMLRRWSKPCVACAVATKVIPSSSTALIGPGVEWSPSQHTTGIQKMWRVGCGVMLLNMMATAKLPKPRFPMRWRPEADEYQGEDWGLCERFDDAKVPVYVDAEASWAVEHVGKMRYGMHLLATQEEMKYATDAERQESEAGNEGDVWSEEGGAGILRNGEQGQRNGADEEGGKEEGQLSLFD